MGKHKPKPLKTLSQALFDGALMDAKEVASCLKVPSATVYSWTASGLLPSVKLSGNLLRFRPEDVLDFRDGKIQGGA